MDFELIPNKDLNQGQSGTAEPRGTANRMSAEQLSSEERDSEIADLEQCLSEFTFSEVDDPKVDGMIENLIDLTVPVTYRVKFNFTPER